MNDKDKFYSMLQSIVNRTKLVAKDMPLDKQDIPEDVKAQYDPLTWFASIIYAPNNRIVCIIELHGDGMPVVSVETEAPGIYVAEVIDEINKVFGKFKVTSPCFHKPSGEISFGEQAYMDHVDKNAKPIAGGKRPPSGKYN